MGYWVESLVWIFVLKVLTYFVFAYFLERVQLVIATDNYGTEYNGIGAIKSVVNKQAYAPMAYRVLVPWLMRPAFTRENNLLIWRNKVEIGWYSAIKILLITIALLSVDLAFGVWAAIITAMIIPVTYYYDYWDWAAELTGICLAASGNFYLALAGSVVHGLSRETAIFIPVVYFLAVLDKPGDGQVLESLILGFVVLLVLLVVRMWAGGRKPLYCDRIMLRRNILDVINIRKYNPWWISPVAISLLLSVFSLGLGWVVGWTYLAIPLLLVAAWVGGIAKESRIFVSVIPWIAAGLVILLKV